MPAEGKDPAADNMSATKVSVEGLSPHAPSTLKPPPGVQKNFLKRYRTIIASSTSSTIAVAVAFPLDTIKTNMQAKKHANLIACAQDLYKNEGLPAFMRGCVAPIISTTIVRTATFTIYQKAKYKYSAAIGQMTGGDEPLIVVNRPGSVPTLATVVCFGAAGATAGTLSSFIACPFELVKNAGQLSKAIMNNRSSMDDPLQRHVRKSYDGKGTFKLFQTIVANRGWLGLYSGLRMHLAKDVLGSAIYFATYESTKQLLVTYSKSDSPTSPLAVATSGGFCGVVSWILVYPIDTAKTRYQRNCLETPKGQMLRKVEIEWFSRQMYRGLGVSLGRTCLTNMVFFSLFEVLKKKINALPDRVIEPVE